jgi:hypothetical protein
MNYQEVSDKLMELGSNTGIQVRRFDQCGLTITGLYVIPEAWFIAMDPPGQLCLGIYAGAELRLVGTRQIPFGELTSALIQELVHTAILTRMCSWHGDSPSPRTGDR